MNEPKRWLQSGALPHEKRLLQSGLEMEAPQETVDEMWLALAALPAVQDAPDTTEPKSPEPPASNGAQTAAQLVKSSLGAKLGMTALVATGLGLGWYALGDHSVKESPAITVASATAAVVSSQPEPVVETAKAPESIVTSVKEPTSAPQKSRKMKPAAAQVPAESAPAASESSQPVDSASELLAESQALESARRTLSDGDPNGALTQLEQMKQRFARGVLEQEREALAIEALARAGQSGKASERASAFIENHPNSPHAARLRKYILSR